MTIRILLADDHDLVRKGFRSLLESQPDMQVVAEVGEGRAALLAARDLDPDIVIMDVAMPGLNGVEATRQLLQETPRTKVLALSMHSAGRIVAQMLQAGAQGYLLKSCALEELVRAVRTVAEGKTYLCPEVAGKVVQGYLQRPAAEEQAGCACLTDREREVLQLVAEGKATKVIANLLELTVKTVEGHRHNIMHKLGIHSVAELTKFAIREGLTPLDH